MASSWERLASVTLGSNSATLSSGTFAAKKYLHIVFFGYKSGGSGDSKLNWNGDTGSNYARRQSTNGASHSTGTSQTYHDNMVGDGGSGDFYATCDILNVANKEKMVVCQAVNNGTAGAGTAPSRREAVMKWVNTSDQITSAVLTITGGDTYNTGSTITVYGADDQGTTATDKSTITNVPVGTRYEEVDTRKIYRKVNKTDSFTDSFTSSSAWSQTGDKWSVNTGNGRVQNAGYSSYSPNDYVHHDMGASFHACDQSFNLRFKVLAVGAGGYIEVGFVDNLTNGDGGDRLNIGLNTYTSGSGYGYTRIYDSINGTNHEVETASSVTPSGMYNTAIWMEMTFNSTTNVCTCKCFSDSGFTTPLNAGTQNLSHTLTMSDYQGLRYLFIGSMHAGGRTLDSGSYVDDITLYTGISDVDDAVSVEWQDKGKA